MRTTGPSQSPLLLLDAVAVLERAGVRYAVVGAMAAAFHGAVRASLDADALLFLDGRTLEKLERDFQTAGFRTILRRGAPDDPIDAVLAVSDAHGNRVDLLAGVRGLDPAADGRTREAAYEGVPLRFIGLEDFVAMKLSAGGPLDRDDARRVLDVSRSSVDVAALKALAARYGREVSAVLASLLQELGL